MTRTSNWRSCERGFTLEDLRPWLGILGVMEAGGLLKSSFVFGNLLSETDEVNEMTMSREIYSKKCFFVSSPHQRVGEGHTHAGDRETKSACWEGKSPSERTNNTSAVRRQLIGLTIVLRIGQDKTKTIASVLRSLQGDVERTNYNITS